MGRPARQINLPMFNLTLHTIAGDHMTPFDLVEQLVRVPTPDPGLDVKIGLGRGLLGPCADPDMPVITFKLAFLHHHGLSAQRIVGRDRIASVRNFRSRSTRVQLSLSDGAEDAAI